MVVSGTTSVSGYTTLNTGTSAVIGTHSVLTVPAGTVMIQTGTGCMYVHPYVYNNVLWNCYYQAIEMRGELLRDLLGERDGSPIGECEGST